MQLEADFTIFLSGIRPTSNQRGDLQKGHKTLRDRINADEDLKVLIISDFLQGSYRRATAVRPNTDSRSDVDIIIVSKLSEQEYSPAEAMDVFIPFLEKHYKGKWREQGRSFGIELSYVDLDLVITSAPSDAEIGILQSESVRGNDILEEAWDWRLHKSWVTPISRVGTQYQGLLKEASVEPEWKSAPLRIPDRNADIWESTHPLMQIQWTRDKNARTNRHFVNVVKSIKWWRLVNNDKPKHPKGFPLERIIGECCPDKINSIAEGVTLTLEKIVDEYSGFAAIGYKPSLPDYGVPSHDVFDRISPEDFKAFYGQVRDGAILARQALDSTNRQESGNLWRELFGSKFPSPPNNGGSKKAGYTAPAAAATPGSGRFA